MCVCPKPTLRLVGHRSENGGETTTSGEGHEIGGHAFPTVTIDGDLKVVAAFLSKRWDRPVSVPSKLARKRVQRTLSGSQEEIAHALGHQLGAKK